ncbi:MAG: hypothetical protein J6S58_07625, partial [Lentisphaeria bacterium]|nr:hypothetical protein [Lentisphaeria bacterium]
MKKRVFLCVLFGCVFLSMGLSGAVRQINAENWSISTGGQNDRYFRFCANELQTLLAHRIGKKLPLDLKAVKKDSPVILLDKCDPALGHESFRIVREKDVIRIQGGTPLGTLFGVYEFLQRYCDVWNVAPGVIYTPRGKSLSFGKINLQMKPAFAVRILYHYGWEATNQETKKIWDAFDIRNRV